MRRIRVRSGSVAAILLVLQVASAAVSSLNACCEGDDSHAAEMRCCQKAGTGHMCPLMSGEQPGPPSGELRATCANGHDEGIPRGATPALASAPVDLTIVWLESPVGECAVDPIWRPLACPSPPPRA